MGRERLRRERIGVGALIDTSLLRAGPRPRTGVQSEAEAGEDQKQSAEGQKP